MSVVRRALKICIKSTNSDCGEEVNKTMKVCPFDQFLLKVDARIVRELGNRNSTPTLLGFPMNRQLSWLRHFKLEILRQKFADHHFSSLQDAPSARGSASQPHKDIGRRQRMIANIVVPSIQGPSENV